MTMEMYLCVFRFRLFERLIKNGLIGVLNVFVVFVWLCMVFVMVKLVVVRKMVIRAFFGSIDFIVYFCLFVVVYVV